MRIRTLALIVAGALIAVAVYQAAAAPEPAPSAEAGTINVGAEALGAGTWSDYRLTVRNLSDRPFFGVLLLAPPAAEVSPTRPVNGLTGVPLQPAAGAGLPDSAYRLPLGLTGRHRRTLTVTAPGPPVFDRVVVLDRTGAVVAESRVIELVRGLGIGLLSDGEFTADGLSRAAVGGLAAKVQEWVDPADFPSQPVGLAGLTEIVIDRFDTRRLTDAQLGALAAWVDLGGALVVAGSTDLPRTLAGLPARLRPARPGAVGDRSLAPLGDLNQQPVSRTAATTGLEPAPGARPVLLAPDGAVLAVSADAGLGHVVVAGFDPEGLRPVDAELAGLGWSTLLGWGYRHSIEGPAAAAIPSPAEVPDVLLPDPAGAAIPPRPLLVVLFLAYLLVVIPGNYAAMRALGRPTLFWLTAPVLAVAVTASAYLAGQVMAGGVRDHQLHLLRVAPDGTYADADVHGVVFPVRGDRTIAGVGEGWLAPLTALHPSTSVPCTGCLFAPGAGAGSLHERVDPRSGYRVTEIGVLYGGVRVVAGTSSGGGGPQLAASMQVRPDGSIAGTLANRGPSSVGALWLFTYQRGLLRGAPLAPALGPGETVSVAALPQPIAEPADASTVRLGPSAAAARLLYLAGRQAAGSIPGRVVVAGLVAPPATRLRVDGVVAGGGAVAAFGAPVAVSGNDARGDFTDVRVLAARPYAAGWRATYDLQVAGLGRAPELRYDSGRYVDLEAYDWSAGGWRRLSGDPDPDSPGTSVAALAPSLVAAGTVRVRVREVGLSGITWGSGLGLTEG